jgi:LPS export ABC transporter protein LptC
VVRETKVFLILKHISSRLFFLPGWLFVLTLIISGCGNDQETINAITHQFTGPSMSAKNIEVVFSDSGRIEAKVYSVLLNHYTSNDPYMEFPKGFKVVILDSALNPENTITANYGKRKETQRIMEARGNVFVRNEVKQQQLNTEQLFWDENRRIIYTSAPVKITTLNKVVYGKGLRANESFTDYTILHPYGVMMVKKDSI